MFGTKIFASSLLISNSLLLSKQGKFSRTNFAAECEEKKPTAAEKSAQDLDAIFAAAQSESGMAPDPEEIQEMLMKAQGRTIR